MKYLITEEQYKRFIKSSPALQNAITKYLNQYIGEGQRKITQKSRNYGNLREDWCVDGVEAITAIFYFEDENFEGGHLIVSKNFIKTIQSLFTVKESFVLHVIEEWYEDIMIPKFEEMVGETGLYVDDIGVVERDHECIPEPIKPEGITDDEMIDFIDKNTGYKRQEIINQIESGERDLEDFYLDIVDTVKRHEILGF
jgi:hypothetical protein